MICSYKLCKMMNLKDKSYWQKRIITQVTPTCPGASDRLYVSAPVQWADISGLSRKSLLQYNIYAISLDVF